MKYKATPRPWEIDGFNVTAIIHNEGTEIWPKWKHVLNCNYGYAEPEKHFENNKANAELIVRAVNSHDELVAALEDMYMHEYAGNCRTIEDAMARSDPNDEFEQRIIAVLKKAKP